MTILTLFRKTYVASEMWERLLHPLSEKEQALLQRVADALGLVADISRSDVMLLAPGKDYESEVILHAQPHSMASLYDKPMAGESFEASERRWLWRVLTGGRHAHRVIHEIPNQRPQINQQFWPVFGEKGPLAAIAIFTNAIERERHKRRDSAFQKALPQLWRMLARGQIAGARDVPPFSEQDGIVFVDHTGRYRYLSGLASNVYRRLGYLDDLRGRSLQEVGAGDWQLVNQAGQERRCVFSEDTIADLTLIRTAVPLFGRPPRRGLRLWKQGANDQRYGAFLLIKDETESRATARELKVKAILLKEVHHRVKNNLQMLVAITRMQARRAQSEEARQLLHETMNRIMSIAVIHEALSLGEDQILDLRTVIKRVIEQVQTGILQPHGRVQVVMGEAQSVMLPTAKATVCALVVNELLLNALEHGFDESSGGRIEVHLTEHDGIITLVVSDNGRGIPEQFSLEQKTSLGFDIIQTLVEDDLRGQFTLLTQPDHGTQAIVRFSKTIRGANAV